ncbi:MAG: FAD-dependent oxidoreductase, partial [Clostridia bacterium]|nr:FAD-dependent oxidoreductase [Clostridia bacterium]
PGGYCFRLTQRLGWVAALENTTPFDGLFKRAAPEGYSLRRAHGYTLLGGFDVKCGSRPAYPFERHLDHMAQHMFPGCKSISLWQGEDCFTADHLPYVGPISPKAPSVLIAAGFQKWGMTNSYAAAEAMTRHVLGAPLDESEILLPQRPHLGSLPPLAARNMETAVSYAKGILRFNRPRCPHMGCRLVYRNASNVWECPCHGSRFSTLGQVINTPAKSQTSTRLRQRPRH